MKIVNRLNFESALFKTFKTYQFFTLYELKKCHISLTSTFLELYTFLETRLAEIDQKYTFTYYV